MVQRKEHGTFARADLPLPLPRSSRQKRPFGAKHPIVAVSTAPSTGVEDEPGELTGKHAGLFIELWGAEPINNALRERAGLVANFWTLETAATYCTGAPLPGVPAPPPNWLRLDNQILLTPHDIHRRRLLVWPPVDDGVLLHDSFGVGRTRSGL